MFFLFSAIPAAYKDAKLDCGYRADIIVGARMIAGIKAIATVAPVHEE